VEPPPEEETKDEGTGGKKKKGDDMKTPLLSGTSSDKESKVEVKDDGKGVGDLGSSIGEGSPLLGDQDPKKVKAEFKDADQKFIKYNPAEDSKQDEPEELPAYMKGRVTIDDELEDSMQLSPFYTIQVATGKKTASSFSLDKFRQVGLYKGLIRLLDTEQSTTLRKASMAAYDSKQPDKKDGKENKESKEKELKEKELKQKEFKEKELKEKEMREKELKEKRTKRKRIKRKRKRKA